MPDTNPVLSYAWDVPLSLTVGGVGGLMASVGGAADMLTMRRTPNPLTSSGIALRDKVRRNWASQYRRNRSAAYDDLEKRVGSVAAMGANRGEGTLRALENVVPAVAVTAAALGGARIWAPSLGYSSALLLGGTAATEAGLQAGQAYGEQIEEGKSRDVAYLEAGRQGLISLVGNTFGAGGALGIGRSSVRIPYSFATEWAEGMINQMGQVRPPVQSPPANYPPPSIPERTAEQIAQEREESRQQREQDTVDIDGFRMSRQQYERIYGNREVRK